MSKARELLSLAKQAKPVAGELPKPSTIFDEDTSIPQEYINAAVGWEGGRQQREKAKILKTPEEWNQKDILKYLGHLYYETTGQSYQYAWAADYAVLRDIANRLCHAFHLTECPNVLMKEYLDYAFDKLVTPHLGRGRKFWAGFLSSPSSILSFSQNRAQRPLEQSVTPSVVSKKVVDEVVHVSEDGLTLEKLHTAFRINGRYFVQHYGVVLHVNYLILVKKHSMAEAIGTVKKAVDKADRADVEAATNRHAPYPNWLPFTDVGVFGLDGIKISVDNCVLGFLKQPRTD
jgi:hypothetical protein